MTAVVLEDLTKSYGRRRAVDGLNLDIDDGEIFGFLGPNGAGKSTTIRLLMGFLRPNRGRARIFGMDCWRQSAAIKHDVGYLPSDVRLYPWMTCASALRIVGRIRGQDLRDAGRQLAERFGLEMNLVVHKMSRGTKQKLGLVLALAHDPRLLILDEPTTGLDPIVRNALVGCLRERAATGRIVFFSSHTLSEVDDLCHRVAILRDGRMISNDTIDALRARAHRTVRIVFPTVEAARGTEVPMFLNVRRRDGREWVCGLTGGTVFLLPWATEQEVEDITISPPDLESLFHSFYRREDS